MSIRQLLDAFHCHSKHSFSANAKGFLERQSGERDESTSSLTLLLPCLSWEGQRRAVKWCGGGAAEEWQCKYQARQFVVAAEGVGGEAQVVFEINLNIEGHLYNLSPKS